MGDLQIAVEVGEAFVYELVTVVGYDHVGDAIAGNDVLPDEALDLVGCYGG